MIRAELNRGDRVLVSLLVLLETEWVLRSRYKLTKPEILDAFSALLDTSDLTIEDELSMEGALYTWQHSSANFGDCLIGARNLQLGCRATASHCGRRKG